MRGMKTGEVCCGSLMDKVMGAIRSVGSRCMGKGARAIEEKESRGEGGYIILINPWPPMRIGGRFSNSRRGLPFLQREG